MRLRIFILVIFALILIIGCTEKVTNFEDSTEFNTTNINATRSLEKANINFANHYIVGYTNETKFLDAIAAIGGSVDNKYQVIKYGKVSGISEKAAKRLSRKPGIKSVTRDIHLQWIDPENEVNQNHIGSDESFWGDQWGPTAISAHEAWDAGFTGSGVRVAVIDGGISSNHMDLDDNIDHASSASFVPGFNYDEDVPGFRHATHVAGIIAAEDNDKGTIGIAPNATIVALKALHDGWGDFTWINEAILYAAGLGNIDVINMSFGGYINKSWPGAAELKNFQNAAIAYAYQQGITTILSAGNESNDMDHVGPWILMPSDAPHAINVSATAPTGFAWGGTDYDTPASYTNYGQSFIDLAAPGGDFDFLGNFWWYDMILAPSEVDGPYHWYSWSAGTSMAAPHVAGVAALIIEKNGGSMHPGDVKEVLRMSADDLGKPGRDDYYGLGRVNAYKAVTH